MAKFKIGDKVQHKSSGVVYEVRGTYGVDNEIIYLDGSVLINEKYLEHVSEKETPESNTSPLEENYQKPYFPILDLEQSLLAFSDILDDLDLVIEKFDTMTFDEQINALMGIRTIYGLRFDKTFEDFEKTISNKGAL